MSSTPELIAEDEEDVMLSDGRTPDLSYAQLRAQQNLQIFNSYSRGGGGDFEDGEAPED